MESLDLRNDPLPFLMGQDTYALDDPTGNSIYQDIFNEEYTEQEITNQLNKLILWETDEEGFINLQFYILDNNVIRHYLPEQLSNLLALYGAIYTFFNQDMTEETFILSGISGERSRRLGESIRRGNFSKYRDWTPANRFRSLLLNKTRNTYVVTTI